MRLTLAKKLYLYTCATVIVVLLATFLILERNQVRQWQEHLRAQSLSFARFATPELLKEFRGEFVGGEMPAAGAILDILGFNRDLVRFELYSPGGRRLFVSPLFPDHIDRGPAATVDEVAPARLQVPRAAAYSVRLASGERVLEVIAPAFGPTGSHVLSARYLFSYDSVEARLAEIRAFFLRIAAVAVLLALVLVALVARRLILPIRELTDGARALARGELKTRIGLASGDELGTLGRAFDDMADSLARSSNELQEKNQELTRANRELVQMQDQLVQAERLAAIGQMAAGVSHEIDNPVGIILGHAELLLEDLSEADPLREDVAAIVAECRRCRKITGGLLDLARTPPGRKELFDLVPVVEQTCASLSPQMLFREVEIDLRIAEKALTLVGDADRLRQVLVNLLINAAQAMGGRGRVRVEVERAGGAAEIRIFDTGPGIPEGQEEKIFEPFYTTKGKGEGTGLGLAICRKLAEEFGGRLSAGQAPGGGALLHLSLPLDGAQKSFDNR